MDKSSTYCVMPHMGMALQNHADICVCNVNKSSWKDKTKQVIHVHTHSIKDVFQSHTRKMIAASLDHGIKHASCQVCWDLETAGDQSPRQKFNSLFEHVQVLPDQPRVLIIKPGNTCNFACRMCNPVTSSSWYADGYELERSGLASTSWYDDEHAQLPQAIGFNEYTRSFENVRTSFNKDNLEFWDTLKNWIPNLLFIDIFGGEPFLTPALFDLLEHGAAVGASKNISLTLHTNASIYNQQYLHTLSQYKKVKFQVSLDSNKSEQLEYIRHKANFDEITDNVTRFKQWSDQHDNVTMNITCTLTPLNVYYHDEIVAGLQQRFGLLVGSNIETTPEYDIRHLPQPVRALLINKLTDKKVTNFISQTVPGCDVEWPKFCKATDKLDKLRNQSFSSVFPDWWSVLEPYWMPSNEN